MFTMGTGELSALPFGSTQDVTEWQGTEVGISEDELKGAC